MVRMHGNGKGKAGSSLAYRRAVPSWLKTTTQEVVQTIVNLSKKGQSPSQIGLILRDSMGFAQVKNITGRKIVRILKHNGLAPEIPEDLHCLVKRAELMRKHLGRNSYDKSTKYHLILVESRIHRLARYYKRVRQLPATWKYEATNTA